MRNTYYLFLRTSDRMAVASFLDGCCQRNGETWHWPLDDPSLVDIRWGEPPSHGLNKRLYRNWRAQLCL